MNLKCECYIHSLKQGEKNVLSEATILKRLGDNDYLAEVGGVKCHAIFNPFVGRYFVDDVYGLSDGILWMMFTALSASRRSAADDKRKYGSAGAGRCGPSLTAAGKEVAECPITG